MFKKKEKGKVLMLIDWENLVSNVELPSPARFSFEVGFERIIRQITEESGEVIGVFVFAPPHLATRYSSDFHRFGFFTIVCPKVISKEGEEQDTTDETLTRFGELMIGQMGDLTHLCLCSGDRDFEPLLRTAQRRGLKIIVVAANLRSLSQELISLTDKERTGRRMVYLFLPTKEE